MGKHMERKKFEPKTPQDKMFQFFVDEWFKKALVDEGAKAILTDFCFKAAVAYYSTHIIGRKGEK